MTPWEPFWGEPKTAVWDVYDALQEEEEDARGLRCASNEIVTI